MMHIKRDIAGPFLAIGLFLLLGQLVACSSQQMYGSGQAWQKNQCSKIIDAQERSRCMASTSTSYDEYRRQQQAAQSSK